MTEERRCHCEESRHRRDDEAIWAERLLSPPWRGRNDELFSFGHTKLTGVEILKTIDGE
jgi:hypothetical protein